MKVEEKEGVDRKKKMERVKVTQFIKTLLHFPLHNYLSIFYASQVLFVTLVNIGMCHSDYFF